MDEALEAALKQAESKNGLIPAGFHQNSMQIHSFSTIFQPFSSKSRVIRIQARCREACSGSPEQRGEAFTVLKRARPEQLGLWPLKASFEWATPQNAAFISLFNLYDIQISYNRNYTTISLSKSTFHPCLSRLFSASWLG